MTQRPKRGGPSRSVVRHYVTYLNSLLTKCHDSVIFVRERGDATTVLLRRVTCAECIAELSAAGVSRARSIKERP